MFLNESDEVKAWAGDLPFCRVESGKLAMKSWERTELVTIRVVLYCHLTSDDDNAISVFYGITLAHRSWQRVTRISRNSLYGLSVVAHRQFGIALVFLVFSLVLSVLHFLFFELERTAHAKDIANLAIQQAGNPAITAYQLQSGNASRRAKPSKNHYSRTHTL